MGRVAWASALAGGALALVIVAPAIPRPSAPVPIVEPTPALIDRIIAANTKSVDRDNLAVEFPSVLKRIGDTGAQIGLAGVLLTCGLKSNDWYRDVTYELERHLDDLYAQLPAERRSAALSYARRRANETMRFNFGDDQMRACRDISTAPFVSNPLVFYPK